MQFVKSSTNVITIKVSCNTNVKITCTAMLSRLCFLISKTRFSCMRISLACVSFSIKAYYLQASMTTSSSSTSRALESFPKLYGSSFCSSSSSGSLVSSSYSDSWPEGPSKLSMSCDSKFGSFLVVLGFSTAFSSGLASPGVVTDFSSGFLPFSITSPFSMSKN